MDEESKRNLFPRLIEMTIGAVRHVVEKHGYKGYIPVGFSIVFYDPNTSNSDRKWYYDMRVAIDAHDPSPQNSKVRERVALVNQFLSEGIKRIFQGHHDDMMVDTDKINGSIFQIPGLKGRG